MGDVYLTERDTQGENDAGAQRPEARPAETFESSADRGTVETAGRDRQPDPTTGGFASVEDALGYAAGILAGRIDACKWVKATCQRQVDDLARWLAADPAWPYEWRPDLADRVIRFVELFPHVKGGPTWEAGAHITLAPSQKFSYACVFGWVRKADGLRRFRTVYEEEPRKNAKTTKLAATSLYMLTADGEIGAEAYSAATKEEQARIVFDIAKQMARMEPEFRERFGVEIFQKALTVRHTGSKFGPLSADADSLDGLNVSFAAIDELHAHKTRAVYDVLDSGRGSRAQPLLWAITTAGSNRAGVCFDVRTYLTKILNAVLKRHGGLGYPVKGEAADDETFWGIIYTIDEGDDYFAESSWRKANPLYGISVVPDDLARMAAVAQVQAQAQTEFLTKRLNIWVNADAAWMNMLHWDACADRALREEEFANKRCWVGLDAAFKKDLFAKVKLFREIRADGAHYYAFGRYYTNREQVEAKGNEHLESWTREGWIRTSPGNVLDIELVREDLLGRKAREGELDPVTRTPYAPGTLVTRGDLQQFQFIEVLYDPAQLTQFATELTDQGLPLVELRPTVLNFSPAMKELEALVASKRFHHNGDPVLSWAISNVVCHRDAKDNIYPRKDDAAKKIDPAIALLMPLARAILVKDPGSIDGWLKKPVTVG